MRHDPQRVLGNNVEIAHLPLVATKGTSREWQTYRGVEMGVQTLFPFLKAVTEDSNLTNFYGQVAVIDASCWTQKTDNRR